MLKDLSRDEQSELEYIKSDLIYVKLSQWRRDLCTSSGVDENYELASVMLIYMSVSSSGRYIEQRRAFGCSYLCQEPNRIAHRRSVVMYGAALNRLT